jgi:hypothetical protein
MTLILTSHRVLVKLMITRNYTTSMPSPYHDIRNSYSVQVTQEEHSRFLVYPSGKTTCKTQAKADQLSGQLSSCVTIHDFQHPTSIHDIQHPSKRYSDHGDYPLELAAQPFTSTPQPLSQHLPNI